MRPAPMWPWLLAGLLAAVAGPLRAEAWRDRQLDAARYAEPTTRYAHAVLGDDIEHGALVLEYGPHRVSLRLPENRVFEDVAPRLHDMDGDGRREAMVVESDAALGARLAIYDGDGLVAATPFIGTRFRWLAPLGAADLDGDGRVEIAYVDRPHLARVLRVWRFDGGTLTEIADLPGVTNHRIGETDIAGGIRFCAGVPEMIVADAGWRRILAVRLADGALRARDIGPHLGRDSFAAAMQCR